VAPQWDDDARNKIKDMQTSIINPEVHLTPVKEKKGMVKDANPELVDNLQMGDKNE